MKTLKVRQCWFPVIGEVKQVKPLSPEECFAVARASWERRQRNETAALALTWKLRYEQQLCGNESLFVTQ